MTNTDLTATDVLLLSLQSDADRLAADLERAARLAADRATCLADRLAKGNRNVNSLGELQSAATDVDRLCALLGAAERTLAGARGLLRSE